MPSTVARMEPMSSTPTPPVSVVIPVRDGARGLGRAVESALRQAYDGELEVVIAVGPSQDETARVASELARDARVRVVDNPTGRTPAGLNAAIAASRGAVIVRCDAFAELPPGYVARAVEVLGDTGAANVGGMQVAVGETPFERAVAMAVTSRIGAGDARYRVGGESGPVDTVYLGVFARDALERVGGFDEEFTRTQDAELNLRLVEAGEVVWFDDQLRVSYRPRGSLRRLWSQYFQYGYWRREVARRHPGSLRMRQLLPPMLVVALGVAAVASIVVDPRAMLLMVPYGLVVLGATLVSAIRTRDPAAAVLPVVVPTIHLSWGIGFLAGTFGRAR